MNADICLEGTLTLKLDDGRVLSELVFGAEDAARVIEAWGHGECPNIVQMASGGHRHCDKEAGHEGRCA